MRVPRPSLPPHSLRPLAPFTNQIPAERRYWVLAAVMLVQFISILTSTIVSTAAPTIVDELHGLDLYAWLFSSYMLASSVTVPVVGKLFDLFGRRPFYIAGLIALFGALTFLPLYGQGVLGYSAQDAGLVLSPLMLGFVLGSLVGGQLTTRTGRYKVQTVIGMAVAVAGMFLLSRLSATSPFSQALVAMVVTGVGVGAVFPTLSVVVQSAFPYRMLGTANAARQFFNNLGAVVGVPVMATIVIETLKNELPRHLPAGSGPRLAKAATSGAQGLIAGQSQGLTEAFGKLPPALAHQVLTGVRVSLATGIERAFLVGTVLAALGLVATFFLPEIPLRGTIQDHPTG